MMHLLKRSKSTGFGANFDLATHALFKPDLTEADLVCSRLCRKDNRKQRQILLCCVLRFQHIQNILGFDCIGHKSIANFACEHKI